MKSFKKQNKFNDRDSGRSSERSFKRFNNNSSRSFGTKESKSGNGFKLHEAVCDKCGNNCDLPFAPTQGKPIYCRSCFRATQKSGNREFKSKERFEKFEPRENFDRHESKSDSTEALDKINRKLDKIMKALKID